MSEKIIEVKDLVKEYKTLRAVDGLSFDVFDREIVGLLGPNGSGKSTTINCILSLLNYSSGKISIFGKEMKPDAYDVKAKIGVIFQDVAVFEELTVYNNIDYFCGLYIRNKKLRQEYIEDAIELCGLDEYRKFRPKQLSGGLLRRLNIACGIAHKPELIFLDEPTVAVDPQSRNNILEGIKKLRDRGATIVYTTHYMEEVEQLCDRILIIDKGRLIASGTSDELKQLANTEEKITLEAADIQESVLDTLRHNGNVSDVDYDGKMLVVSYSSAGDNLGQLIHEMKSGNVEYSRIYSERPTLNDVFLELTGKELRD